MNKNIAIINTAVASSYDQNIVSLINNVLEAHKDINGDIYTTTMNVPVPNKRFGILPIYEAKYFKGKAIVWDFITLDLVYGFPNISEIIYIHNNTIPWRENSNISYRVWSKLFLNKKLKFIISDNNIYEIFKLTWNIGTLVDKINEKVVYETI